MTITIRGHFDGKVIVPDEPVKDLPVDQPLTLSVSSVLESQAREPTPEAMEAYQRLMKRAVNANIPTEALRRKNMYEDR
jgi:hypothetical protein